MKTINNLWDKVVDEENIKLAILKASKGKRRKRDVRNILNNIDYYAKLLSNKLKSGTWRPKSIHNIKMINDGLSLKKREIVCPQFLNELVVQHAVIRVCKPYFLNRFYRYSCASIPGRGVEYAIKHIRKSIKDVRRTKYFTTLDIKSYFNSVKPSKVFHQLRRIFRDKKLLFLYAKILKANKVKSPSDGLIKRGMPIGFYSSQWLANVLLTPIDNLIKSLGVKHYFRYNDDLLIFSPNKRALKKIIAEIFKAINSLGLKIKRPPQIHRFSKVPIRYIGAIIYPHKIILQEKVFIRACRVARRIKNKGYITVYDARRILAYSARFSHYNMYNAYKVKIASSITKKRCKQIIKKGVRRYVV